MFSYSSFAGLGRIVKAYNYFLKRINATLEESTDKVVGMFRILDKVNSAILVMIEVSNHADAYTLFESLNNRGTPLYYSTSRRVIYSTFVLRHGKTEA